MTSSGQGQHDFFLRDIIVSGFMENVYIVGDQDAGECLVIDPGAEGERVMYEVDRHGLTVKFILNTHGHLDHTGAVATVKEISEASYGLHRDDNIVLRHSAKMGPQMIPGFRDPPDPDFDLKDGDTLNVGRFSFQVVETPGHSPGSVCFVGHGVAFTGDTLFRGSIGRFDTQGGDGKALLKSIMTRLMVLPDDTSVYPGHGPASTIGDERKSNPFLQPGAERHYIG